jgi:AraC-like DNA-binding protein
MLLMAILAGIVVFYSLNDMILNDLVSEKVRLMFAVIYILPPPLIYIYWYTYIYGKMPAKQTLILNLLPLLFLFTITFFSALLKAPIKICLVIIGEITVLYHLIYPIFMLNLLRSFYGIKKKLHSGALKYNPDKTSILKIFMFMMLFHSMVFLFQFNLPFFFPSYYNLHFFMKIHIFFMIILQYLITWVIITIPVVIHFTDKKIGLAAFKKYEHSSLSMEEAKLIAYKLNTFMELSKPYQNPLYSVQDLTKDIEIDYIDVAETLNGLIGQSFNDYINNYRIEEVKRLFKDPNYKQASIISIAFESGFNSKAAFYSSFKKFTGETPSQCRKHLLVDN